MVCYSQGWISKASYFIPRSEPYQYFLVANTCKKTVQNIEKHLLFGLNLNKNIIALRIIK